MKPKEVGAAAAEIVATLGGQLAAPSLDGEQQGELEQLEGQMERVRAAPRSSWRPRRAQRAPTNACPRSRCSA
eukprot:6863146-Prymnesium_polylepis.1